MPSRSLQISSTPSLLEPLANRPAYGSARRCAFLIISPRDIHHNFLNTVQSVIIWAGAITNVAMVVLVDPYLRTPPSHRPQIDISAIVMQIQTQPSALLNLSTWSQAHASPSTLTGSFIPVRGFLLTLLASYGVIVFKRYVQHILHSINTTDPSASSTRTTSSFKNRIVGDLKLAVGTAALPDAFWAEDEGEAEISKKKA